VEESIPSPTRLGRWRQKKKATEYLRKKGDFISEGSDTKQKVEGPREGRLISTQTLQILGKRDGRGLEVGKTKNPRGAGGSQKKETYGG